MMEWHEVQSSSMQRFGYDGKTKTLEITFRSGRTYRYREVPGDIVIGLFHAQSKGGYFAEHIVGKFDYRCLNPKPAKGDKDAQAARKKAIRKALEADPPKEKTRIS